MGAFAWDKHCARNGMWRVPERTLLGMAFIGGTIGAVAAQHGLRHKTRKEPFRTQLYLIAGLQVVSLGAVAFPTVQDVMLSIVRSIG
ncbi:DUF1294 domain-containing protein [Microvirga sp. BT688]|uniref:DUF1294 domain-containing protein n=1 Tax=Microvirga sp. TaxID=1873136 RepID=UPI0016887CA5|nr:DUF1294 domain-containing protein [Microvirga sp.]MBD2749618.1 DUF1294 domain-containing protein [Microvirga sp.]